MRTLLWLALLARVAGAQVVPAPVQPLPPPPPPTGPIVILTGRALDGRGGVLENASIGVARGKITSLAGFTTVQSVGAPSEAPLRDMIRDHGFPGPRVLTSPSPIQADTTVSDDSLRAMVRRRKAQGADLIKIFASKSERVGAGPTITEAQLRVLCGEAAAQGLRSMVHAYRSQAGAFISPQVGLVVQNYLENRARYVGAGGFTDEGMDVMERDLPRDFEICTIAVHAPMAADRPHRRAPRGVRDARRRRVQVDGPLICKVLARNDRRPPTTNRPSDGTRAPHAAPVSAHEPREETRMCFSPAASFTLSSILTVIGVAAVAHAERPAQRLFAATPLVFGAQQAAEGIVWLTIGAPVHGAALELATRVFLGVALVLWPAWVPFSLRRGERRLAPRRALDVLCVWGVLVSVAALFLLVHWRPRAHIAERSLTYSFGFETNGVVHLLILTAYLVPTVAPFFVGTSRLTRAFGVLLVVAVAAAGWIRAEALTSVWCFFAAGLSVLVYVAVGEDPLGEVAQSDERIAPAVSPATFTQPDG